MGTVKEEMKPSSSKSEGLLAKMLNKRKGSTRVASDEDIANKFVDHVTLAYDKIEELIGSKEKDLANEKGQEAKNKKSLRLLERMQQKLEELAEDVQEYKEL